MNKWLKILIPVALLVLGIVGAFLIVKARPEVETVEAPVPRTVVRVQRMQPETVTLDVRAQGTVEPRTASALVTEVGGRILEVAPSFVDGGFFRKGQTLLRVDPRDYRAAVAGAQAQVSQAEVRMAREEAEAQVALAEWEDLGGGGDAPPLVARKPQMAEARAALDAAKAALQKAQLDLQRTEVRAPYAGLVREKLADVGQFVGPGTPVAQIFAVDYAEIKLPVPSDQLGYVDLPGAGDTSADAQPRVELSASMAGQRATWNARVVRTEGEIDPASRMLGLIARVDDPYSRQGRNAGPALQVGQFVDARIEGRTVERVFVLPRIALRGGDADEDQSRVLVLDESRPDDPRLRYQDVEVLRFQGDDAIVTRGLNAGDQVCVSALEAPIEGMRVRVADEEPAASLPNDDRPPIEQPPTEQPPTEQPPTEQPPVDTEDSDE